MYIIIVLFILIIIYYYSTNTEHFYDRVPQKYYWNTYSCYSGDCAKNKSYQCYKFCNSLDDINEASAENCRLTCMDEGDRTFDNLKFGTAIFGGALPRISNYSLLRE